MDISTGEAMLASTGANILAGAFGGDSYRKNNRAARKAYKYALRYQPAITQANTASIMRGKLQAAKEGGLHPLFALGSAGAGSSPSFQAGQSQSGSFAKDALSQVGGGFAQLATIQAKTDLVEKMAELEKIQQADRELSNDTAAVIDYRRRAYAPEKSNQELKATTPLTEFKKGEVGAYNPKAPSENLNVLSPMTTVRIGSQLVKVPVEEAADFMEDPLAAGLATYAYHGNKHIDWGKLAREYLHGVRKRGIKKNASPPPIKTYPTPNKAFRGHGYRPKTWR